MIILRRELFPSGLAWGSAVLAVAATEAYDLCCYYVCCALFVLSLLLLHMYTYVYIYKDMNIKV